MVPRTMLAGIGAKMGAAGRASAGLLLLGSLSGAAFAQSSPSSAQRQPALEPRAMEVVKAASAALAGANTLSFTAVIAYERAARNGQPLHYALVRPVTIQRPDKLGVGVDDHLPRRVRVVYANEPAHARYQTEFSDWKLNVPVPPGSNRRTSEQGRRG